MSHQSIRNYFSATLMLFKNTNNTFSDKTFPAQIQYWEEIIAGAEDIVLTPYKEIPDLPKVVHRYTKNIELKQCYATSGRLASSHPDIEYVEGHYSSIVPVPHAWNRFNGYHFDLTAEVALAGVGVNIDPNYVSTLVLSHEEVLRLSLELECWGEYGMHLFQKRLEEERKS